MRRARKIAHSAILSTRAGSAMPSERLPRETRRRNRGEACGGVVIRETPPRGFKRRDVVRPECPGASRQARAVASPHSMGVDADGYGKGVRRLDFRFCTEETTDHDVALSARESRKARNTVSERLSGRVRISRGTGNWKAENWREQFRFNENLGKRQEKTFKTTVSIRLPSVTKDVIWIPTIHRNHCCWPSNRLSMLLSRSLICSMTPSSLAWRLSRSVTLVSTSFILIPFQQAKFGLQDKIYPVDFPRQGRQVSFPENVHQTCRI